MANGESITTQFSVDISELKAGIQEANRQIKLANSQFKNATAGMDNWASSADGITAKLEQLSKVEAAEVKKLEALQEEYRQVAEEQGENSAAAQNLAAKLNNQEARVKNVAKEINDYNAKLNEVQNVSAQAETASEGLSNAINKQEKELTELKTKYKDVILEQGENSAAAQELAAKITALNADLQANKTKLNEADSAAEKLTESLDDVGQETKTAGDGFTVAKGALSGFIANAVSNGISKIGDLALSMFNLAEETREYRSMLAKVEGSANSFGYSIDYAKDSYKEFYKYLNDDQMATNAITNLMGLQVETGTLDRLVDGAISTWAAYGDSIPIESLTESINETIQVSKVTGTMADTLNWASLTTTQWNNILGNGSAAQKAFNSAISEGLPVEDAFNAALAVTTDKQERANMVAGVLNSTYGESKKTYDELNGSILNANEAQAELKDTQAELAKTVEPLNTEFTKLKNKALKALSPSINKVTKDFTKLVEDINWNSAADSIGNLMETAASGLQFVLKNINPILTGIKALATAWLTYKTAQLAANATTTIANATLTVTEAITKRATVGTVAHTAATKASTVATKALSLAQKATPWGLIASLVSVAVVGIGSYITKTKEAAIETNKNTEATNKITESYKEYNDALTQNKKTREENITSAAAEAESANILLSRMEELAAVEDKSNSQKALMKQYVEQLNELVPELNLQYDEEKDKLNKTTGAIRDQINAQKNLILAKAAQEQLQGIAEDMVTTELELADAEKQHKKNRDELTKATDNLKEAQEKYKGVRGTTPELQKAIAEEKKARENYEKTEETVENLKGDLEGLEDEYSSTEGYAQAKLNNAEIAESFKSLAGEAEKAGVTIPKAVSEGIENGKYAVPQSVDELKSLITYDDLEKQAKDSGIDIPKNITDGIKSGKLTPAQAVDQMNALVKYDSLVQKAKDSGIKVPKSITEGVKTGEITPAQAVDQMNSLVSFNDLLSKSSAAGQKVPANITNGVISGQLTLAQAVQQMKDLVIYDDMLAKAKNAGITVPKNITNGVASGKLTPAQAVQQINDLMTTEANKPAGKMRAAGANDASSLAGGVRSGGGGVKNAGTYVAGQGLSGAKSKNSGFRSAGGDMARGIEKGTRDRDSSIFATLRGLAGSMLSTFKKAIDSNSPSKLFEKAAATVPQGVEVGVDKNKKLAIAAMKRMGNDIAKEGENIKNAIGFNDLKYSVSSNLGRIRSGLNATAYKLQPAMMGGTSNITFNQYNTSPKSLDSLEVYRNTQRQLNQFKRLQGVR